MKLKLVDDKFEAKNEMSPCVIPFVTIIHVQLFFWWYSLNWVKTSENLNQRSTKSIVENQKNKLKPDIDFDQNFRIFSIPKLEKNQRQNLYFPKLG